MKSVRVTADRQFIKYNLRGSGEYSASGTPIPGVSTGQDTTDDHKQEADICV